MKRLQDWPARLFDWFARRASAPFEWGSNDCVLYAMDSVQEITGEDPIPDLRDSWTSALQARRAVDEQGGMVAALDARFQRLETPLLAQRGDIGVLPEEDSWRIVVVCFGTHWAGPGPDGVITQPFDVAEIAWAVGR